MTSEKEAGAANQGRLKLLVCGALLSLAGLGYEASGRFPSKPSALVPVKPVVVETLRKEFPVLGSKLTMSQGSNYEPVSVQAPDGATLAGFKSKEGYLGSSQSSGELKPEERRALEALASKEGRGDGKRPLFFVPRKYGAVAIGLGGDYQVFMKPEGASAVPGEIEDGAVVYPHAYPGVSVIYSLRPEEMEALYLIEKPLPRALSWRLYGAGETGGFVLQGRDLAVISKKTGRALLKLSPPVVFDSAGKRVDGSYQLQGSAKGGWLLALSFRRAGLRYPLLIDPIWTTAGASTLSAARYSHTATLLPDGKVLVAGGTEIGVGNLSSAELYDPIAGTWTTTGPMNAARMQHTATLLPNGKVLVAGGNSPALPTAELYDPAAGIWTLTNSMSTGRQQHTATLLPNGKVLVAGGNPGTVTPLSSAELYDPAAGTWTTINPMSSLRESHTATLLPNGKVLVAGGYNGTVYLSAAELYDPIAGTWAATGVMTTARNQDTATLLPNGKVLVAGGAAGGGSLASAELYDPAAGAWAPTGPMTIGRQ